jgi:single-strand DNA-binding protein
MSNLFSSVLRIGGDAELRHTPSGAAVVTFSGASSTGFGDKQQTLWIRVSYWRNPEKLQPYLLKGGQVFACGELTQREYQKDGQTKTILELNATVVDLIGGQAQAKPAAPAGPTRRPTLQLRQQDNFADDFDDDIPF